ncbi:protein phosphatase 2C domain-containing protein [Actinomadura sp. 9N407]|uniref:protein phosphatase 2C domain-containing protein n=1 Tax=Actinomadura sp. 9N407 TaxID=3375154 RepID=UPI0037B88284
MLVSYATEATPGLENEDLVVAGTNWAVVLDGATARPGVDCGCTHGPRWLVQRLGGELAGRLASESGALADLLAESIKAVREMHPECDLGNRDSPSTTVAMLRWERDVEWLVLADSPVLLDTGSEVRVIRDDRVDRLPSYTTEAVRAARNSSDGFWVASTRPEAAYEALTGEATGITRAALLSDGAARLVERFGLMEWNALLDLLDREGAEAVIRRTRAAEAEAPELPRGKRYDDATAVLVHF